MTFRPAVLPEVQPAAAQVPVKHPSSIGEDGTKSALSRHQVEAQKAQARAQEAQVDFTPLEMGLLELCKNVPKTGVELMTASGYASRTGNLKRSLEKLKSMGLFEMTIPDKPRSSKQKYRLTEKGQNLLDQIKRRKK